MYSNDIDDSDEIKLLKELKRTESSARMILRYDVIFIKKFLWLE
jgi:hypothetical protein